MYIMVDGIIDNKLLLEASQYKVFWCLATYAQTAARNWHKCGLVEKQFYLAQLSVLLSRLIWLVADKEIT